MELITNYFNPPKKTLPERIRTVATTVISDYIRNNPGMVLKGTAAGILALYGFPITIGMITWLPYIGCGIYVYQTIHKFN
jgi:hypothetical protein